MGSYNDTCMLTNLPIRYGEPVVGVLVEIEDFEHWFGHKGALPCSLPLHGTYDDYGCLDYTGPDCIKDFTFSNLSATSKVRDFEDLLSAAAAAASPKNMRVFAGLRGDKPVGLTMMHKFAWDLFASGRQIPPVYDKHEGDLVYALKQKPSLEDSIRDGIEQLVKQIADERASIIRLRDAEHDTPEFEAAMKENTQTTMNRINNMPWWSNLHCPGSYRFNRTLPEYLLDEADDEEARILKKAWYDIVMVGLMLQDGRQMWLYNREGGGMQSRFLDIHARKSEAILDFIKHTWNRYGDGELMDEYYGEEDANS